MRRIRIRLNYSRSIQLPMLTNKLNTEFKAHSMYMNAIRMQSQFAQRWMPSSSWEAKKIKPPDARLRMESAREVMKTEGESIRMQAY